jgi:DNA polymerase alpha subunit B
MVDNFKRDSLKGKVTEDMMLMGLKNKTRKIEIKLKVTERSEYFHLTPSHKKEYFDHRLSSMKNSLLELIGIEHFESISKPSGVSIYVFGMISSTTGSKLEHKSVYLFNSLDDSNVSVLLDLSRVPSYSLFNGQIVGILGSNPSGNCIHVEKIFYKINFSKNLITKGTKPLKLVILKGPFIKKVVKDSLNKSDDVFIFMGPFVEDIKTDQTDDDFKDLNDFTDFLNDQMKLYINIKIVMVPSLDDYAAIKIFPQIPLNLNPSDKIMSLSNPCTFEANSNNVVISNFDNLFDLELEEIDKIDDRSTDPFFKLNRIERLANHLIFQKSFVPCFNSSLNVSFGKWLDMEFEPDLYIISSKRDFDIIKVNSSHIINIASQKSISIDTSQL